MWPLGVVLLVVAGVFMAWSAELCCRANPHHKLPWLRQPPNTPSRARTLRAVGLFPAIFGGVQFADVLGYWGALTVLGVWVGPFSLQLRHNRSVDRETTGSVRPAHQEP